ncbi:uncharacterized protein EV154DRAFT_484629 [Mucor mucedo]|uniref:uncharacterized protein n=1 Tax=Mucor mucedo TaxID=29922 RepID=UPI002220B839|nr:uncharacterized protein EV154DRAFT_484629 [Mucor mucedo]KAI7887911.1 hypothetical protein EV154DRAFT_484629 [Mucor mucedo]
MPFGSTSKLALCTRVSYEEREKKCRQFIKDKNADRSEQVPPEPPLEPFTRSSYNIDLLKNYVIYRSLTGIGRVEDKIQLGTMIREFTHLVGLEASISGSITFEFQVVAVLLIVLYSGARPSSLSNSVKHDDANMYRSGDKEEMNVATKSTWSFNCRILKVKASTFPKAIEHSKKTFTSAVADGVDYEQWYQGNLSLLELEEDRSEEPVFINSLFSEKVSPWTSDSVEHTTSRRIANSGLHSEVVQGHTIDPLLNPAMFHIKDISRCKLTDGEMREGVDGDERVTDLFNTRTEFIKELNKNNCSNNFKYQHSFDVQFQLNSRWA